MDLPHTGLFLSCVGDGWFIVGWWLAWSRNERRLIWSYDATSNHSECSSRSCLGDTLRESWCSVDQFDLSIRRNFHFSLNFLSWSHSVDLLVVLVVIHYLSVNLMCLCRLQVIRRIVVLRWRRTWELERFVHSAMLVKHICIIRLFSFAFNGNLILKLTLTAYRPLIR